MINFFLRIKLEYTIAVLNLLVFITVSMKINLQNILKQYYYLRTDLICCLTTLEMVQDQYRKEKKGLTKVKPFSASFAFLKALRLFFLCTHF